MKQPNVCSQCIYFLKTQNNVGVCRRYPPKIINNESRYPVITKDNIACAEGKTTERLME